MTWNIGIYTYTCLLFYSIQEDLHPFSYMPPIFLSWSHYNSHSLFIWLAPPCFPLSLVSGSGSVQHILKAALLRSGNRPGSPSLTCASSGEHILKGLPLSLSLCISSFLSSPPVLLVSLLDLKSCPYAPSFMACLVRSVRLTGNC